MRSFNSRFWPCLFIGFWAIKAPMLVPFIDEFCLGLVTLSTLILNLFDAEVMRSGVIIYRHTYGYSIEVAKECSGLEYFLVFVVSILAIPVSWASRAKGILLAFAVVEGLNLVRIMSLLYLKVGLPPRQFDIVHEQVLPYLLNILLVIAFMFWCTSQLKSIVVRP